MIFQWLIGPLLDISPILLWLLPLNYKGKSSHKELPKLSKNCILTLSGVCWTTCFLYSPDFLGTNYSSWPLSHDIPTWVTCNSLHAPMDRLLYHTPLSKVAWCCWEYPYSSTRVQKVSSYCPLGGFGAAAISLVLPWLEFWWPTEVFSTNRSDLQSLFHNSSIASVRSDLSCLALYFVV